MKVCPNGHTMFAIGRSKFCNECGAPLIDSPGLKCGSCGSNFKQGQQILRRLRKGNRPMTTPIAAAAVVLIFFLAWHAIQRWQIRVYLTHEIRRVMTLPEPASAKDKSRHGARP